MTDRATPPEAHAPTAGLSALLAELAASHPIALFREATERWPEDERAYYEIGEALGDVAAARAAVAQLLGEWSGADADVPLLAEARALAARL